MKKPLLQFFTLPAISGNFAQLPTVDALVSPNADKRVGRFFRRIICVCCLFVLLLFSRKSVFSQSCANYVVTRATGVTYTTIAGTGTSNFIWRNTISNQNDDNRSFPVAIGFDFWYLGVRYTNITASLNGTLDFSASTADGNSLGTQPYGGNYNNWFSTANGTHLALAPMHDDLWTGGGGTAPAATSMLYNVSGSAPNRILTVEWLNFDKWPSSAGSQNFQTKIHETTGIIEFVYGTMTAGTAAIVYACGINNTWSAGGPTAVLLLTQQNANTTTFSSTAQNALATLPASNSRLTFTPPAPTATPTGLTFTGIMQTGMTLNWADNASNEDGYVIYTSTDGINYSFATQLAAGSVTVAITGLLLRHTYFWQVYAVTEGNLGIALTGSQATLPAGTIISISTGNWSTLTTWDCSCVPTAGDSVIIANGTNVILDSTGACNKLIVGQGISGLLNIGNSNSNQELNVTTDITVNAGATMTTGAFDAAHTMTIGGNLVNNGTLNGVGTVTFNGTSSQTISGTQKITFNNLILSNSSGLSLSQNVDLLNAFSFGVSNARLTTNGFLTIKSSAANTGRIADVTNNGSNTGNDITGDVTVERYIAAAKKWRLLSIPTGTIQTINEAWQEGCGSNINCDANFGTQITGPGGVAAGFDVYTATPSMKTYNTGTNGWVTIPNTNISLINNPSNNTVAYFVFVRGDRNATTFTSPVSPTILRTKGVIKQGNQPMVSIASPANAFTVIGNPYPSPIDLRKMTPAPTTSTKIYVWDPIATNGSTYGLGAYQTLTYNGTTFAVTPGGGSYGTTYNHDPNYIESGVAFLAGGKASAYNITFKEDIKASANDITSYAGGHSQSLKADLFINKNGVISLMDGITADVGNNFSNDLDDDDAYKILNSAENVSLKRNGQLLSVERHNSITIQDTFYINIGNLRIQNYQWQLNMENLDQPGLTGFLEDNYLHTSTPLNLNGSIIVDFNIENIPGSYAPDRFRVVFSQLSTLSLSFISIKAYQENTDLAVEWKVENESNMKKYDVEKSIDGNHFELANTVAARNTALSNYKWLDVNPSKGYNYYRILSTLVNGKREYSTVVKVFIGKSKQSMAIYPNPVANGIMNLQLTNQPAGVYGIQLFNKIGQLILSKQINHAAGSSTETIQLDKYIHGICQMKISNPDGSKTNINVSVLK